MNLEEVEKIVSTINSEPYTIFVTPPIGYDWINERGLICITVNKRVPDAYAERTPREIQKITASQTYPDHYFGDEFDVYRLVREVMCILEDHEINEWFVLNDGTRPFDPHK